MQQQAPAPMPQAQQMMYSPPRQPVDIFSKKMVAMFIVIGLILMFVGAMVCNASEITNAKDRIDDDKREGALATYKDGMIVYNVGMLLLVLILFASALLGKEFTEYMRLGMFVAAGLILGFNLWGHSWF